MIMNLHWKSLIHTIQIKKTVNLIFILIILEFKETPLFYAVNVEMAQLLLDWGADINHCDIDGNSVLSLAILQDNTQLALFYIEKGIDVNVMKPCFNSQAKDSGGFTPIFYAVNTDASGLVRKLLQKGANPNVIDENGDSPLSVAVFLKHLTCISVLLVDSLN